jgi:hypothetical protein
MTPLVYSDDLKGKMPQRLHLSNGLRWLTPRAARSSAVARGR